MDEYQQRWTALTGVVAQFRADADPLWAMLTLLLVALVVVFAIAYESRAQRLADKLELSESDVRRFQKRIRDLEIELSRRTGR